MNKPEQHSGRNRLRHQKSPYLLQHASNPVDWYPWCGEAFERARRQDRPVFLSIGYSTCHWCHVMAHESFEDPEVAGLMNDTFVCVKVDREERPDIDDIYMTVCQMLTGSGGWPLTIIMTPDKKPFFAATYLPREDRFGRAGMLSLVPRIAEIWKDRREELAGSADKITQALKEMGTSSAGSDLKEDILDRAYNEIEESFDAEYGGFGAAPKFPAAHKIRFLLRYWRRTGENRALEMVEKTLRAMRAGGLFDQIGFGFHRYSTDRAWLLPHFEKMLCDQAALAMAYTEACQASGKEGYRQTAFELLEYVLRDMTCSDGGFYSAEDADSEGEEGKFYIWTQAQIREALKEEEAEFAIAVFNAGGEGNFREEATGRMTGANVLHPGKPQEEIAKKMGMDSGEFEKLLETVRTKLLAARGKRVRPLKDDKILADWNGLMIAALARAGAVFGEEEFIRAAEKAAGFIIEKMEDGRGRLLHRYRGGEAAVSGFIDDYAFMILGLTELYQATFRLEYLRKALEYSEISLNHYWDEVSGGFFTAPDFEDEGIVKKKRIYDGALPSGNSVMMLNLIRLARLTGNSSLEEKASGLQRAFSDSVRLAPQAHTGLLAGLDFALGPSYQVVIAGDAQSAKTLEMIRVIQGRYIPNKVVLFKPAGPEAESDYKDKLESIAGFAGELEEYGNRPAVYICEDFNCRLPIENVEDLVDKINNLTRVQRE